VEQGHGQERGDVEPYGHVHVPFTAAGDGAEHVPSEHYPYDRDQDVDRPFQLCVLLARREAQRQRHCGKDDDELPSPEVQPAEEVTVHARLAQSLQRVIDTDEDRIAREGEDDGIRMQWAKTPIGQLRNEAQEVRCPQFDGDDETDEHSDDAPYGRRDREVLHDGVVVGERFDLSLSLIPFRSCHVHESIPFVVG